MEKSVFTPEYAALRSELVKARAHAGLTQRELAARLGVPPSWVAKVESGERRLDLIELCRVLEGCGAEPLPTLKRLLKSFAKHSPKSKRE